ncbi:O-antigen ligase family protein [Vibrio sp. MA40-2]|uniref:O-antigen ligase family protein n=1 Tax=Vibrio sp. MA40-2 TaxID=3391828 RepID=UPI0039A4933C
MNNMKFFDHIICAPIYLLFTSTFFIENADKKLVIFVLVSLIVSIAKYGKKPITTNIKKPLNILLIITIIYLSVFYYIYGGSSQEIRVFLVMLVLFIYFPQHLLTKGVIDRLLIIGSFCSIGFVLYNKYALGLDRGIPITGGGFNPIPYASAASIVGLISIYRFIETKNSLLLIPIIFYSAVIIFTQTRGVILPFLVIFPLFFLLSKFSLNKKGIAIATIILLGIAYIGHEPIESRIKSTIQEINAIQEGNLQSSIGLRLQFWDAAVQLIKERPVFGFGDQHSERYQQLYHQGKISKAAAEYSPTNYHNQYLDTGVKKGIVGLILLLSLQSIPIVYLCKYQASRVSMSFAFCLFTLFIGISMTATPFRQALPMMPILFSIYYVTIIFANKEELNVK